ncbi:FecR domain-containing protein [Polaromonas sp. A23]|uniref:FecR domain-containing protein n=1 Tax=Polaromonas sp. A23 TaxID=1944133 RepID=UPI0009868D07|nr:FecR domain-containing protein [Polaromonas sp. A23]OOG37896.1 hypothetical protein B0B52_17445 [Polaromonas sp. A23]
MKPDFHLNAVLLATLAAACPLQAHALAGVAQFTAGEVNVRQADGRTIALAKGGNIDSGQAIVTGGTGRAQVKFTDGGLISLQPNTEFKIANYVDQNDPKEDRFLVDLLRGGMRAITGLIGKRNRDNYKLTTTTATIGIRGSGFKVGYNPDGSLGISSELDKIEVCNQSGCIGLVAGESVKVVDSTTPPVRTSGMVKNDMPKPPEKEIIVIGERQPIPPQPPAPKELTFTDITVLGVATDSSNNAFNELGTGGGLSSTFEVNGAKMLKVNKPGAISTTWAPTGAAVGVGFMGGVSDPDFLGWGSWVQTSKEVVNGGSTTVTPLQYFHYIAGRPTSQMPTTGTATYIFAGGTSPTRINGGGTTVGTINAANTNLSVNFGAGSLTANIDTSFVVISDTASIVGASFSGTYVNGFFTGAGAARAGLTFKKSLTVSDVVTGAVVFTKQ